MNLFPDKTRNSLQLGRIPPRCTDDTVCCAATAAAAAGWLLDGGSLSVMMKWEKFQRSEHSHAEGNWRLPPKNSARYAFNSPPHRDTPQSLIMFAVNQTPAVIERNGILFRQGEKWEGGKAEVFF